MITKDYIVSDGSILSQWLALAKHYTENEAGYLCQNRLYACAYYQCALAEYNANRTSIDVIEKIYKPLFFLKQKLLAELTNQPISPRQMMPQDLAALQMPALKQELLQFRNTLQAQLKSLQFDEQSLHIQNVLTQGKVILQQANNYLQDVLRTLWAGSRETLYTCDEPPCAYALIAFGSLTDGFATLYSDLEFGILIADSKHKDYFRKIAQLMQFNTLLLGETTLTILRPPEYYQPEFADLFKRCKIPNGISFDGAGEGGGKSPLGARDKTDKVLFELIGTPQELATLQQQTIEGYATLALDIVRPIYIVGNDNHILFNAYVDAVKQFCSVSGKEELLIQIDADLARFIPRSGQMQKQGRIYSVKHDLFRLPVLMTRQLILWLSLVKHNFSQLADKTTWESISYLKESRLLQAAEYEWLKALLLQVALLRLDAYLNLGEQAEQAQVVGDNAQLQLVLSGHKRSYPLSGNAIDQLCCNLIRFYQGVKSWLQDENCLQQPLVFPEQNDPLLQGQLHEIRMQHTEALAYYDAEIKKLTQRRTNTLQHTVADADDLRLAIALEYRARVQSKMYGVDPRYFVPERVQAAIASYQQSLTLYETQLHHKGTRSVALLHVALAQQYTLLNQFAKVDEHLQKADSIFNTLKGRLDHETLQFQWIKQAIEQNKALRDMALNPLYHAYKQRTDEADVQQGLRYYIKSDVTSALTSETRFDTQEKLTEFLNSNKKLLILWGDSGSGKSISLRYLERELWGNNGAEGRTPVIVPVFIELGDLPEKLPDNEDVLSFVLKRYYSGSLSSLSLASLKTRYRFVFLLDGADELRNFNLIAYRNNALWQWPGQFIISCRTQYVATQTDADLKFFTTRDAANDKQEYYLAPFTEPQITSYLDKYIKQNQPVIKGGIMKKSSWFFSH